jgi:hypothetical protein
MDSNRKHLTVLMSDWRRRMTETLKTETCVRCGVDLESEDIGKTTMCGWCECDIRNAERRRLAQERASSSLQQDGCAARWSVKPIFAWYDVWVGIFWDSRKRKLYILPLPCVGLVVEFPMRHNDQS